MCLKYFAVVLSFILFGCQTQATTIKGAEMLDQLPEGARAVFQPLFDSASKVEGYEIVVVKRAANPTAFSPSIRGDEIWCVSDKVKGMSFSSAGLLIRNGNTWKASSDFLENWIIGCG